MTPEFADAIASLLYADIFQRSPPVVMVGLTGGQTLSFTDRKVLLFGPPPGAATTPIDEVELSKVWSDRAAAEKLGRWLGEHFGGESGAHHAGSGSDGWMAWAAREDGSVLAVSSMGYLLYDDVSGLRADGRCRAARIEPERP